MALSVATRAEYLNRVFPSTGAIGVALLLDNLTPARLISSINTSTGVITLPSNDWVTQTRARFSTTGSLPVGSITISTGTDYFLRRLTATTYTLHPTRADAAADTNQITFSDAGTDNTLTEQALSVEDALEVLVNHEIDHADYLRYVIEDVGTANALTGALPSISFSVSPQVGNGSMIFAYYFVLEGGTTTLGDTTGTKGPLDPTPSVVTVTEGDTRAIAFNLSSPAV